MPTDRLTISTPGRVCLFGEHQDYLSLPVIPRLKLTDRGLVDVGPGGVGVDAEHQALVGEVLVEPHVVRNRHREVGLLHPAAVALGLFQDVLDHEVAGHHEVALLILEGRTQGIRIFCTQLEYVTDLYAATEFQRSPSIG